MILLFIVLQSVNQSRSEMSQSLEIKLESNVHNDVSLSEHLMEHSFPSDHCLSGEQPCVSSNQYNVKEDAESATYTVRNTMSASQSVVDYLSTDVVNTSLLQHIKSEPMGEETFSLVDFRNSESPISEDTDTSQRCSSMWRDVRNNEVTQMTLNGRKLAHGLYQICQL